MKITYDKLTDAGYVYLKEAPVSKTFKANEWLMIDIDDQENIVGIEMLDVSLRLSERDLENLKNNNMKALPVEVLSCIPSFV